MHPLLVISQWSKHLPWGKSQTLDPLSQTGFTATHHLIHSRSNQSNRKQGIVYNGPLAWSCTTAHTHTNTLKITGARISQTKNKWLFFLLHTKPLQWRGVEGKGRGRTPASNTHLTFYPPKGKCMTHTTEPTFAKFAIVLQSGSLSHTNCISSSQSGHHSKGGMEIPLSLDLLQEITLLEYRNYEILFPRCKQHLKSRSPTSLTHISHQ